jgi:ubiquinone/menaquinone biosynthesis C-methylase UbiE/uncharacterized protein YbaR (Trm112 family)
MRLSLLDRLRCPISGQPLQIDAIDFGQDAEGARAVRTGVLWSPGGYWYPLINHVPILLVFRTALTDRFAATHAARIAALPGAPAAPDRAPERGERSVQTTFTEEWAGLEDDTLSFTYDEAQLTALHRDVWLRLTDEERTAVTSVLDVGVGFGKEARVLAELFPSARVTGVDLNLAVVSAGRRLVETTRVDPVVGSLFHLPFENESFRHVTCQGVLHHTRSTKAGFDRIAEKVAPGGSLFVWVYAAEDPYVVRGLRGLLVKLYWWISHGLFRPVLSRSPGWLRNAVVHVISAAMHPIVSRRGRNRGRWRYVNTVHGIRDAFTPRYAHQHGFNEVIEWFEEAGFEPRLQSPATYRRLFGSRLLGVGVIGRRSQPSAPGSAG